MPNQPYRVLLVDYRDTDVAGEIPSIFHRAGCTIDVYCSKESWLLKSRYATTWHNANGADPKAFVAELSLLARTGTYDWIVLLDDASLYIVQDYADEAAAQQLIPLTNLKYRSLVGSKAVLSTLCQELDILTPTFAVHDERAAIVDTARAVPFPLLLKIDRSGGGKGLFLCNNEEELQGNYNKIAPHHQHNLLIQHYIVGDNISVEALYCNGELITYAPARVTQNVRNEFDVSCVREYEPVVGLAPVLQRVGSLLSFNGFCSFTFIREHVSGALYIVEADLRTHAWFALSRLGGVDFAPAIRQYLEKNTRLLPPPETVTEVRHFARDIVRAFRTGDKRTIWHWICNKGNRWQSIPTHDARLLRATVQQIGRTLFYDHVPRLPYARSAGRMFKFFFGNARRESVAISQDRSIIRTYFRYFFREKRLIIASALLSVVQIGLLVPLPIIAKNVLDTALPQKDAAALFWSLALGVFLLVCSTVFMLIHRHATLAASKSIIATIRRRLIERALSFHFSFYATEDLEQVHSRIVEDTERLDRVTNAFLAQTLPALLIATSIAGVLLYLDPLLFSIIMLCLPPVYLVGRMMGKRVRENVRQFHTDFTSFSTGTSFVLKFNELITLSAAATQERQRQNAHIAALEHSGKRMAWVAAIYSAVQNNVMVFCGSIVFLVGGMQLLQGTTTIGSVLSFFAALNIMIAQLRTVISSVPMLIEGAESCRLLLPLLEPATPSDTTLAPLQKHFGFPIIFENISFTYGSSFALRDVSFAIADGSITGVFGASGSGKTTLIRLLLGVYTPTRGAILVAGKSLDTIDAAQYRRMIGTLPQEPLLFPGTIRENLVYGLEDVTEDTLIATCNLCHIHETIMQLPHGYDTVIGHRGATLSGGQKQRIAIARALLRRPKLLIFDEPDNHLDDHLITEIMNATKQLGCTTILISHNAALRTMVDRTLTVADGHVTSD